MRKEKSNLISHFLPLSSFNYNVMRRYKYLECGGSGNPALVKLVIMESSRSPDEFQNFQFVASVRESVRNQLSPIIPSPQSGDVKDEGKNADKLKEEGLDDIYEHLDEGWFPSPLHIVSEAMGKFKELEEKYQQKLEEDKKLIACLEWKLKIVKTRNLYAKNNLKTINLIFNKWKSAVKSVCEY